MKKNKKLDPALYWRVKAAFLQHKQTVSEANASIQASGAALDKAIADAGLEAGKSYDMNDADETITPKA